FDPAAGARSASRLHGRRACCPSSFPCLASTGSPKGDATAASNIGGGDESSDLPVLRFSCPLLAGGSDGHRRGLSNRGGGVVEQATENQPASGIDLVDAGHRPTAMASTKLAQYSGDGQQAPNCRIG
ncbi:unnamed protein product, partial [Urochloa humidicola]